MVISGVVVHCVLAWLFGTICYVPGILQVAVSEESRKSWNAAESLPLVQRMRSRHGMYTWVFLGFAQHSGPESLHNPLEVS